MPAGSLVGVLGGDVAGHADQPGVDGPRVGMVTSAVDPAIEVVLMMTPLPDRCIDHLTSGFRHAGRRCGAVPR